MRCTLARCPIVKGSQDAQPSSALVMSAIGNGTDFVVAGPLQLAVLTVWTFAMQASDLDNVCFGFDFDCVTGSDCTSGLPRRACLIVVADSAIRSLCHVRVPSSPPVHARGTPSSSDRRTCSSGRSALRWSGCGPSVRSHQCRVGTPSQIAFGVWSACWSSWKSSTHAAIDASPRLDCKMCAHPNAQGPRRC